MCTQNISVSNCTYEYIVNLKKKIYNFSEMKVNVKKKGFLTYNW